MQKKEKEYIDWIHHLERQLQDQQEKSKKKLEVTHAKKEAKQVSESSSVLTGDNNQYESVSTNKFASQVGSSQFNSHLSNNECNNSKINRRHKIFDPVGKANSVSPCNKALSPLDSHKSPLTPSNLTGSSKLINPLHKPKPQKQQP